MSSIATLLFLAGLLVLASVLASKASTKIGVPSLLLFLVIGMLAGSDGPGGIEFSDADLARFVGVAALVLILFSGGLDTNWSEVRPVAVRAGVLSTVGVLVSAILMALFAVLVAGFSVVEGLLLGAVISSTDAAAVFSVLRSRNVHLGRDVRALLEMESGVNDPMAVFLTLGFITLAMEPGAEWWRLVPSFALEMAVGGLAGLAASVLVQGPSIPLVAKWLGLRGPAFHPRPFEREEIESSWLAEWRVPESSPIVGAQLAKMGLPDTARALLVRRYGRYLVPTGGTRLRRGDTLLLLVDEEAESLLIQRPDLERMPDVKACQPGLSAPASAEDTGDLETRDSA